MSGKTLKLSGWKPFPPPAEGSDIQWHRQLIIEIVFGQWHKKKELLAKMSLPPQPVSLNEIYKEYESRIALLDSIGERHRKHTKRWLDRRVNECAAPKYSPGGTPKIVAVTAGLYAPHPNLFTWKKNQT